MEDWNSSLFENNTSSQPQDQNELTEGTDQTSHITEIGISSQSSITKSFTDKITISEQHNEPINATEESHQTSHITSNEEIISSNDYANNSSTQSNASLNATEPIFDEITSEPDYWSEEHTEEYEQPTDEIEDFETTESTTESEAENVSVENITSHQTWSNENNQTHQSAETYSTSRSPEEIFETETDIEISSQSSITESFTDKMTVNEEDNETRNATEESDQTSHITTSEEFVLTNDNANYSSTDSSTSSDATELIVDETSEQDYWTEEEYTVEYEQPIDEMENFETTELISENDQNNNGTEEVTTGHLEEVTNNPEPSEVVTETKHDESISTQLNVTSESTTKVIPSNEEEDWSELEPTDEGELSIDDTEIVDTTELSTVNFHTSGDYEETTDEETTGEETWDAEMDQTSESIEIETSSLKPTSMVTDTNEGSHLITNSTEFETNETSTEYDDWSEHTEEEEYSTEEYEYFETTELNVDNNQMDNDTLELTTAYQVWQMEENQTQETTGTYSSSEVTTALPETTSNVESSTNLESISDNTTEEFPTTYFDSTPTEFEEYETSFGDEEWNEDTTVNETSVTDNDQDVMETIFVDYSEDWAIDEANETEDKPMDGKDDAMDTVESNEIASSESIDEVWYDDSSKLTSEITEEQSVLTEEPSTVRPTRSPYDFWDITIFPRRSTTLSDQRHKSTQSQTFGPQSLPTAQTTEDNRRQRRTKPIPYLTTPEVPVMVNDNHKPIKDKQNNTKQNEIWDEDNKLQEQPESKYTRSPMTTRSLLYPFKPMKHTIGKFKLPQLQTLPPLKDIFNFKLPTLRPFKDIWSTKRPYFVPKAQTGTEDQTFDGSKLAESENYIESADMTTVLTNDHKLPVDS